MRKRARPSEGWFVEVPRKSGALMVEFRWHENGNPRSRVLGSLENFPTEKSRWKEVIRLGLDQRRDGPSNLKELVDHWLLKECPESDIDLKGRRAFSTRDNYRGYLRKWVVPQWGGYDLEEVKPPDVEEWLATLTFKRGKKGKEKFLAEASKKKIRDVMHILYEHARRWEWWPQNIVNPISQVRQGGKRQGGTPLRLSVEQLAKLIYQVLKPRERIMVLLDFCTGMRRGELSGVKWTDFDFDRKTLLLKRSVVKMRVGELKTEASGKIIPIDDDLIAELLAWRSETPYATDSDYVFASPKMRGKQPYWVSRIMQHHIKPAAAAAGIPITGWHTLRHSYTTLLRQNGSDPRVVQDLLRWASMKMIETYDAAVDPEKRHANTGVVRKVTRLNRVFDRVSDPVVSAD